MKHIALGKRMFQKWVYLLPDTPHLVPACTPPSALTLGSALSSVADLPPCAVCLEVLMDNVVSLPCLHQLHTTCARDIVEKGQGGPSCLQCPECQTAFTEKGNLRKHIKSVHRGDTYPCHKCDYKASRKCDLQSHIKMKHKVQDPTVTILDGYVGYFSDFNDFSNFLDDLIWQ